MLAHRPVARHLARRSHASPPRQGPRRLRCRRRPAHRRHRSHLRVRLRARLRHSRQGQGADAAVGVLVRAHGRPRAAPSALDGRRRVPRADCASTAPMLQRALDARAPDRSGADRVRRARLPLRVGLEGIPADRGASAASRCRPACASPTGCRSRSSRRRRRRRPATTTTSARRRPAGSSARRSDRPARRR